MLNVFLLGEFMVGTEKLDTIDLQLNTFVSRRGKMLSKGTKNR